MTSNVYKVTLAPDKDLVVTWNNVSDKARIEADQGGSGGITTKYLTGAEFTLYQVVDDQDPAAEEIEVNGQKLWLKAGLEKYLRYSGRSARRRDDQAAGSVPIICGRPRRLLTMKNYFYEISQEGPAPSW